MLIIFTPLCKNKKNKNANKYFGFSPLRQTGLIIKNKNMFYYQ